MRVSGADYVTDIATAKQEISQLALVPTKRRTPILIDAAGKETELPEEMLECLRL